MALMLQPEMVLLSLSREQQAVRKKKNDSISLLNPNSVFQTSVFVLAVAYLEYVTLYVHSGQSGGTVFL